MEKKNEILEVSFRLAVLIIDYSEDLEDSRKYVIARQLIKSGTSIGANIREAQSAESMPDFIHKLKIAHKETIETEYWLELLKASKNYPKPSKEIEDLLISTKKLLNKIISSSKKKLL